MIRPEQIRRFREYMEQLEDVVKQQEKLPLPLNNSTMMVDTIECANVFQELIVVDTKNKQRGLIVRMRIEGDSQGNHCRSTWRRRISR